MLPETSQVNVERQPCDEKLPCAGASMRSTIDARISMYTTAKANADAAGESSKSRRFAERRKIEFRTIIFISYIFSIHRKII